LKFQPPDRNIRVRATIGEPRVRYAPANRLVGERSHRIASTCWYPRQRIWRRQRWRNSSRGVHREDCREEFPELRNKYWGQYMWARGYFCATVGAVDEATIKAYIGNQKWDEDDQGFKITAPTEP
jgi:REP element-mobilizing transposase RayT